MKKIINTFALLLCAVTMSSCNDWLDMTPTNKVSEKVVWANPDYVEQYIYGFYPYINIYGSFGSGDSQVGLTEGCTETLKYTSIIPGVHVGFANMAAFAKGGLSAENASYYYGCWDDTYTRIRRVNEFLYGLGKYGQGHSDELKLRWEAEARFFRGLLYFQIAKRYGQAIIYSANLQEITQNIGLNTAEETWEFIYQDLEFAGKNLPATIDKKEAGKLSSAAAYALESRAMLYAERWQDAKDAADKVLAMTQYDLMSGTTANDYAKAFTSAQAGNKEAILEYNFLKAGPNHSWDDLFMPGGDYTTKGGRAMPTQEMVESYELATTGGYPDWTPWHTVAGTNDTPPYAKLEPRFHASVLYNGCDWKGRKVEPYVGGKDGWVNFNDGSPVDGRSATGYYLRKMLDEKHTDYSVKSTQTWVAIRLAEVILNHAEACYRLKVDGANADLRRIRTRVGLPYADKSGDDLFAAIRQERKIELYCEGHLWWDMRRWKLADKAYSGSKSRVHGFKIEKQGTEFIYTYVDCDKQDRLFETKLYRIALPLTELSNNNKIKQFPEWL